MVQDVQRHEDRSETELRARILELETKLVEAGSDIARKALHEVVTDIVSRREASRH